VILDVNCAKNSAIGNRCVRYDAILCSTVLQVAPRESAAANLVKELISRRKNERCLGLEKGSNGVPTILGYFGSGIREFVTVS
jgi:hypothetical protein